MEGGRAKPAVAVRNAGRTARHTLQQLFWECTLRCNLSCIHCGSDCRVSSVAPDMPFEDFEPVLDGIAKRYDASRITIVTTGGEPLVRHDIVECGRKISQKGFIWGTVSNGMLIDDRKLRELKDAGLRTIAISLDGFEQDHNWMRGNAMSFSHAVRAIKALAASRGVVWDVITCVNNRTIGYLEELKHFLLSIGVKKWRLFTVAPMGRAVQHEDLFLAPAQFRQLLDFIVKVKAENTLRIDYSCEGYLGAYEGRVRTHPFFCQAGINVASILSDGSISGCLSIRSEYNEGNIYQGDNFVDVWENGFQRYRDHGWMKTGACEGCEAWDLCLGGAFHLRDKAGELLRCSYDELK